MRRQANNRQLRWWRRARLVYVPLSIIMGLFVIVQLFFPDSLLPFFTQIAGIELGTTDKAQATVMLDRAYKNANIGIYFGSNDRPYREVKPADIGLTVTNTRRINKMGYPWYIRFVPTSLLWWGLVAWAPPPNIDYDDIVLNNYLKDTFGSDCKVEPINASLEISGESIHMTAASTGGKCSLEIVREELKSVSFPSADRGEVRIDINEAEPAISNQTALNLADRVSKNMIKDLELGFDEYDDMVTIHSAELISWLSFQVVDNKLTVVVDEAKSTEFYRSKVAPLIETSAGVTTITTSDLMNFERENGMEGKMINIKETNLRIAEYLMDERQTVVVAVESTDPTIQYVYQRPSEQNPEISPETEPENRPEETGPTEPVEPENPNSTE